MGCAASSEGNHQVHNNEERQVMITPKVWVFETEVQPVMSKVISE